MKTLRPNSAPSTPPRTATRSSITTTSATALLVSGGGWKIVSLLPERLHHHVIIIVDKLCMGGVLSNEIVNISALNLPICRPDITLFAKPNWILNLPQKWHPCSPQCDKIEYDITSDLSDFNMALVRTLLPDSAKYDYAHFQYERT